MKREMIIWQAILVALGAFLILTIKTYLRDRNEIIAETSRAQCVIDVTEKGLDLYGACTDIKNYKLQDSAKGL
ncbi:hypothetical protein A3B21_01595 [Candidatus Uhrbacteria bacterium RIFCSPLOWO2_01_FULL_47_24]|uniref:Uncharacterized protein n=1 Tax=Candidatus Uhrbacteria bacterium RIFCSPLOWO2_01_FULL_47_24 TaxID=1802401 RepID=A0A1F7URZ9_9BACT|nr:MAG: hypothetical protein A2753_04695 [Candidatus Uhrbacteria bacterium RIFCSPHIGHO2_01_FULL_47_11]OGL68678.1 MAG: hypothetical protein A3D58_02095 [Candidatus Uhrbacteria bacterium RIFCSPHIGHO2_02_FULL_46_47]OGL74977.1 MAG: hypothetical protein A3F52_03225 [Candidatus Uhrbacteria bacterium RIFCSPHIGHO2_12_FULL_47_11]OGL81072.1 MAG: hypothetical protein A3B21_01595 [Candidatus Uhrbacteria bacterium RIFCSPLOWO2_01_FULL_47_24]OGL84591.1 MAG: hypothetical protein A3J03_02190 [Candidatus Uhrbact